ncbi:hypothetical protein [Frankia sp. Cr1]|uniref:hypothetical protein n=1 Tax=Frankia sp. Cr1 TaxID=3073931 RepID=UPI002AD2D39F|nr:hypothetical protein [Frankia sp. Cr1]
MPPIVGRQDTPYTVVALNPDGQPERVLILFSSPEQAEQHAQFHQLDSYRVVPAQLSLGDPRAKKT